MYKIQLLNNNGSISSIYDQSRVNERSVSAPTCSLSINEAGTLEFTLTKNHPFINALEPLSSFISVLDDGEEIFYGRVLKRSDPTLTGMVTFNCEGALTFLLDSEIPPDGKDGNGNQITRNLTAQQFFEWCITTHNSEVDDSRRQFTVGTVNADQRYKVDTYSISNYTQTKSAIENQILDVYGGFIRIRPKNDGGHYIDWIQNYETLNPQPVQIGNNIEDQTNETDGSDLFTVLRPVGKDGITLDTPTIDLYPSELMNKYGRIVKTIEFKNATTKAELQTQANDYKQRIEKTLYINSSIQLVDLHYLDGTKPKIRLGDRFNNINGLEGTEVVVSSIELHFEAPQNDTIELKNRKSLDPDLTPEGNRHNGKNSYTKRGSKKESQYFKYLKEYEDTLEVLAPKVYMHGELLQQHYERIEQQAGYYESLSSRADSADEVISSHTETVNNIEQTIRSVVGTARLQDGYTLTDIAGKFEIWEDQNGHVTVHLKDGAALTLDDTNGQTVTVGTRLSEVYNSTNNMNQFVQNFHGSTLWTQRDNITGIVGHFTEVDTVVPDPDHPGQYKTVKKLVVESGGGFQLREDGVEYGLYMTPESAYNEVSLAAGANPQAKGLYEKLANGTYVLTSDTTVQSGKKYYKRGGNAVLTAGMIVDKINNETVTKIQGDRVNIVAKNVKITADKGLETIVGHWEEEEYLMEDGSHHPIIDPVTGEQMVGKRLVYKADGGMRVRRLNDNGIETEFGVYDDGNLTGGIMAERINDQTTVRIRGDRIIVGDDPGDMDLVEWDEYITGAHGLIAGRATIGQLQALEGRFDTLDAQAIKASNLFANIASIDSVLNVHRLHVRNTIDVEGYSYANDFVIGHDSSSSGPTNQYMSYAIKDLQIIGPTNNVYTLQYKTFRNNEWQSVSTTFSRATALSGTWSGTDTYTITASPQGVTKSIGFSGNPTDQHVRLDILTNGTPTASSSNDKYIDVPIKVNQNNSNAASTTRFTTTLASVNATPAWDKGNSAGQLTGWSEAYGKVSWPAQNTSSASMTVKAPAATKASTPNQQSVTYTVSADANNAYIKLGTIVMAQVAHGQYSAGQLTGWSEAYGKVSWPAQNTSSASMTVKAPAATKASTPNQQSVTYTVSVDNDYAYIKLGTIVMARTSHNLYNNGFDAGFDTGYSSGYATGNASIQLTEPSWRTGTLTSTNTVTVKTIGRDAGELSKSVTILLSQGSWSNKKKYVEASEGNTTIARVEVDASSIYQEGWSAGYSSGAASPDSSGRATGWREAYAKLSWPSQNTNTATMTVKGPAATIDSIPDQQSVTYTVSADADNAYIKLGTIVMAQAYHGQYSAGYNAAAAAMMWPAAGTGTNFDITYPLQGGTTNNRRFTLTASTNTAYVSTGGTVVAQIGVSGTTYAGRTFYCTGKQQTHPGSSTYYYFFRIEGNYAFSSGTNYTFYRTSWPT